MFKEDQRHQSEWSYFMKDGNVNVKKPLGTSAFYEILYLRLFRF